MRCQGSESEAKRRLPADMSPPWKVGHEYLGWGYAFWQSSISLMSTVAHTWCKCLVALQVMLLSDGSVTRHLQLLTDLPVQVVSSAGASEHLCIPMCMTASLAVPIQACMQK